MVFKPLQLVTEAETPKTVVFLVNPDQLSALVTLAGYGRDSGENVIVQFGAGCHQIGILTYREAEAASPRAVIGLTDLSARKRILNMVDRDILSFSVPFRMFREMEANVEGSFLEKESWAKMLGAKKGGAAA